MNFTKFIWRPKSVYQEKQFNECLCCTKCVLFLCKYGCPTLVNGKNVLNTITLSFFRLCHSFTGKWGPAQSIQWDRKGPPCGALLVWCYSTQTTIMLSYRSHVSTPHPHTFLFPENILKMFHQKSLGKMRKIISVFNGGGVGVFYPLPPKFCGSEDYFWVMSLRICTCPTPLASQCYAVVGIF